MAERRTKYGNAQTMHQGVVYDSRLEAEVARVLDLLHKQGRIAHYERQWPYVLAPSGRGRRAVCYVADFVIADCCGRDLVLEARGYEPASSRLKRRWFMDKYPHIPLCVVHEPEEVVAAIEDLERADNSKESRYAQHTGTH